MENDLGNNTWKDVRIWAWEEKRFIHQRLQTPKEREGRGNSTCPAWRRERRQWVTGTGRVGLEMQGPERGEAWVMVSHHAILP